MLLCNSFSRISVWISGTRCISSVFSSSTTSLVSTSPRRTAPITLAANGILCSFLCLIHRITDLKTNVYEGALRSSRPIRFKNWSASIWDKNSSLSQTSLYNDVILHKVASFRSFRPCKSANLRRWRYVWMSLQPWMGCLENDDPENEDLRPRKRRPRKQRPRKRRPRKRRQWWGSSKD